LRREGVDPGAFIWVHAQNDPDPEMHARAAEQGAWIELDGIAPDQIESHVRWVHAMRERGLLGRVLISQDAGWYSVGTAGGGAFRPFGTLVRDFIPALRAAGFAESDIHQLTVSNPREAFTVRVRAR
jgi:predicted metal-dependent phosphotriesterase family hydrolase